MIIDRPGSPPELRVAGPDFALFLIRPSFRSPCPSVACCAVADVPPASLRCALSSVTSDDDAPLVASDFDPFSHFPILSFVFSPRRRMYGRGRPPGTRPTAHRVIICRRRRRRPRPRRSRQRARRGERAPPSPPPSSAARRSRSAGRSSASASILSARSPASSSWVRVSESSALAPSCASGERPAVGRLDVRHCLGELREHLHIVNASDAGGDDNRGQFRHAIVTERMTRTYPPGIAFFFLSTMMSSRCSSECLQQLVFVFWFVVFNSVVFINLTILKIPPFSERGGFYGELM